MLPVAPYDAFVSGSYNDVPLLVGFNADEARSLVNVESVKAATFAADIERSFGPLPPPLMDAYPHATDAQARQARLDFERDLRFGWDMWAWARLQAQSGKGRAYFYHFMQEPPFPQGSIYEGWGASHFAELWYMFDHLDQDAWKWSDGGSAAGRDDVRLLDELREGRRSERRWSAAVAGLQWQRRSACTSAILFSSKACLARQSLQVFDAVYNAVRGKPFGTR